MSSQHRGLRLARALVLVAVAASGTRAPAQDLAPAPTVAQAVEAEEASALLRSGDYRAALDAALAGLAAEPDDEEWHLLAMRGQLALGEYAEARALLDAAIGSFSWSLPLRLVGYEVCRRGGDPKRAQQMLAQIQRQARVGSWRYRDAESQVQLGRARLLAGDDPKEVLDEQLRPAEREAPKLVAPRLAIAELALSKHDYALASEAVQAALALDADDAELHLTLARALAPSDPARSAVALSRALELNPAHAEALLLSADQLLAGERNEEAEARLAEVLALDPNRYEAWCYRAVLAHLAGDAVRESECRARALLRWPENPEVEHLIGRELSEKYRFAEGAAAQRRALELDPGHAAARFQLAQDLLRLGREDEGWRLAEQVLEEDPFNVVAYNLMVLHDELADYRTLERGDQLVRMQPFEADVYGALVQELVARACADLAARYELELEGPVLVELFSRQADFAIRTFGLPGGEGFLGVCFGDVVTMQSPGALSSGAAGASQSSWEATLWHELAHVVTLNKTNNRMPRWLSEGISVFEERRARPDWGRPMTATWRERILAGSATPLSKMSSAFLSPESPQDLAFAYFEAGQVVAYLIETYGEAALVAVLADLGAGVGIDAALQARAAPLGELDTAFEAHLRARALAYAPDASWEPVDLDQLRDLASCLIFTTEHPDNVGGLLLAAMQLLAVGRGEEAEPLLQRALELEPTRVGPGSAYALLARHLAELGDETREAELLTRWTARDADALAARVRLAELQLARADWEGLGATARGWLGIQPMDPAAWRALLASARSRGEAEDVLQAGGALLALGAVDPAGVHYELARAALALGDREQAKREVLRALEEAPRYREAHRLLLELIEPVESIPAGEER